VRKTLNNLSHAAFHKLFHVFYSLTTGSRDLPMILHGRMMFNVVCLILGTMDCSQWWHFAMKTLLWTVIALLLLLSLLQSC